MAFSSVFYKPQKKVHFDGTPLQDWLLLSYQKKSSVTLFLSTMVEYAFKSGATPRSMKRLITMLRSDWANRQTWKMVKLVPNFLLRPTICIFMSWHFNASGEEEKSAEWVTWRLNKPTHQVCQGYILIWRLQKLTYRYCTSFYLNSCLNELFHILAISSNIKSWKEITRSIWDILGESRQLVIFSCLQG